MACYVFVFYINIGVMLAMSLKTLRYHQFWVHVGSKLSSYHVLTLVIIKLLVY